MQIASLKSTVRGKKDSLFQNAIRLIEQFHRGYNGPVLYFLFSFSQWQSLIWATFCTEHCTQKSVAENFGSDMIRTRYFWVRSSNATSVLYCPAQKILLLSVASFLLSQNRGCFQRKNFLLDFSSKGFYLQVERKRRKRPFFFLFKLTWNKKAKCWKLWILSKEAT